VDGASALSDLRAVYATKQNKTKSLLTDVRQTSRCTYGARTNLPGGGGLLGLCRLNANDNKMIQIGRMFRQIHVGR
jgi:hypothetical protein